jgi:hypothetical protein
MYSDPKWIHWISSESFSCSVSLHLAVAFYSKEYQQKGSPTRVFSEDADECVRRRNHTEQNLRRDTPPMVMETQHQRSFQPIDGHHSYDGVSGNCDACKDWLFSILLDRRLREL